MVRPILALTLTLAATPAAAFHFAGFTFDAARTPDLFSVLVPASYDGAVITGLSTSRSPAVHFPDPPTSGFDYEHTIGVFTGASPGTAQAYGLPVGHDGTVARSGFALAWSGGRALRNGAGNDFVVFENASSATDANGLDGFMVRVRFAGTTRWSRWRYEAADSFSLYSPRQGEQGAFATAFDLTFFGVPAGGLADAIQLVNLTDEDRMQDASGQGYVLAGDAGATSSHLPTPGPLASFASFGRQSLDPDPLYVAVLQAVLHPLADDDEGSGLPDPPVVDDDDELLGPN